MVSWCWPLTDVLEECFRVLDIVMCNFRKASNVDGILYMSHVMELLVVTSAGNLCMTSKRIKMVVAS